MKVYPFTNPIVLTDSIFIAYGGHTGTSTSAQRTSAYLLSEMTVSDDLGTLLLPQTITGTFIPTSPLLLEYGYVNYVSRVDYLSADESVYYTVTGTDNYYVSIRDSEYGIIDIDYYGACGICGNIGYPYKLNIVYNAGLPTGTSSMPNVLMALTIYADIILGEIMGYGNESSGDIGVQSFRNQQYSEDRVRLFRTSFGSSPRAHMASRLLQSFKKHRYVGI